MRIRLESLVQKTKDGYRVRFRVLGDALEPGAKGETFGDCELETDGSPGMTELSNDIWDLAQDAKESYYDAVERTGELRALLNVLEKGQYPP